MLRAGAVFTISVVDQEIHLFAYGSLLRGELHQDYLVDAVRLGPMRTAPGYRLVELERFPALIESGDLQIEGELYAVTPELLRRIDELKENGRLFLRRPVRLENGQSAEAYLMEEEKLRGRRRLRATSWHRRFESGYGHMGLAQRFGRR